MGKYIIGVDVGTSTVKSILFGAGGEEVCVCQKPVELLNPMPGLYEHDMNQVWESTAETIRGAVQKAKARPQDVAAISVTSQADGLWMIGKDGQPVGNAISWTDFRAYENCVRWCMDGTDQKVYATVGSTFYPGSYVCLIKWLLENDPGRLEQAESLVICKDWIKYKLTGVASGEESFAITADTAKRRVSQEMIGVYGFESVAHKIPPIQPTQENHDPLTEEKAAELGLAAGIPVFAGPIDFIACSIGAGVVHEGEACAIIGTTTMLNVAQDTPNMDPPNIGFTIMNSFPNTWMRCFGVMAGTPNLEWAIATYGQKYVDAAKQNGTSVYAEIEKEIAPISPGADGVMYHPYITAAGERAPFLKPTAKAQFTGLSMEHTTAHIMRAVYEGVGFSLMDCIDASVTKPKFLRVVGGGAKSELWCQIIADMTGLDVVIPSGTELGAKGSALMASVATGMYPDVDTAIAKCVKEVKRFCPDMEKHAKYEKLYGLYKAVYQSMWEAWDLRAGILMGQA